MIGEKTLDVVWDLDETPEAVAARAGQLPPKSATPRSGPPALGFSMRLIRQDGTTLTVRPGDEVWLGRHSSCGMVVADGTASRFHATIKWDPQQDRPTITDSASQNGTRVGAQALVAHTPRVLRGDEELTLGEAPPLRVELCFAGVPAPALLTSDSDETVLFTDAGPCFAGQTHGQAELHRVLLALEARRRTASVRLEGEGTQARLTFCLGQVVTARYGRLRGQDALLQILQMGRAALMVSRSFEPEEAELQASIRATLAQQGEDTKRWARPAGEDLVQTQAAPAPTPVAQAPALRPRLMPIPTPPPPGSAARAKLQMSDTLFTVEPQQVWKKS